MEGELFDFRKLKGARIFDKSVKYRILDVLLRDYSDYFLYDLENYKALCLKVRAKKSEIKCLSIIDPELSIRLRGGKIITLASFNEQFVKFGDTIFYCTVHANRIHYPKVTLRQI